MTDALGCIDCGWSPGPDGRWPSEGKLAAGWIQTFLICAEGDWYGKKIQLRPDQKRFIRAWYEYCPSCGYWRYDNAVRGAATGDGKTTFVAAVECLEMFGPPAIVPVSPNIINAAASFDQADKLFGFAGTMLGGRDQVVKEAPLCGYADVYDTEIKRADGTPGIMQRVAAVAGTNEGGLPSLFVCDEVHEWGEIGSNKARVHMVIGKSTSKRELICRIPIEEGEEPSRPGQVTVVPGPDGNPVRVLEVKRGPGRILNISTAGFDVDHSLLGSMYKEGLDARKDPSLAPRLLFDWREARPGLDYSKPEDRRVAVQDASDAAGVLWNIEKRVREYDKASVEEHEWIRYYANSWVPVPADSWLVKHPAAWGKCQGEWDLAGDEPAVLAIDLSLSRDSTAVVEVAQLHDGRLAVMAKIWLPAGGRVPHKDVSGYVLRRIAELGDRFRGVVYDPALMQQIAEDIEDAGVDPVEFSQEPSFMAPACAATFDAIVGSEDAPPRIVHDGDVDFTRQVLGAARRQTEKGFTLSKGKSRGKIDSAVALCMGVQAMALLPPKVDPLQTMW